MVWILSILPLFSDIFSVKSVGIAMRADLAGWDCAGVCRFYAVIIEPLVQIQLRMFKTTRIKCC